MNIERKINLIELLTLVVLIAGGVFGFFFIERVKLDESSANANLSRIAAEIAKVDKSFKRILAELAVKKEKVNTTLNVSDFIADIQPNIEIYLQPAFEYRNNTMCLIWEITNIGKHTVVIDEISLLLSPSIIETKTKESSLLRAGEDYIFVVPTIGELPPNQKTYHSFEIQLSKHVNIKRVFHFSKFNSHIHPSIMNLANTLLGDYFTENEINKLVVRSFGRSGWLEITKNWPKRQIQPTANPRRQNSECSAPH